GHRLPRDVRAFYLRSSAGGKHAGGQNADRRRLAGAVRPQQTEELTARNLKGNTVEGFDFNALPRFGLVRLTELFDGDYGFHDLVLEFRLQAVVAFVFNSA